MKITEFHSSISDPDAWPKCPKCGGREMIVSGPFIGCMHCFFTGSARAAVQNNMVVAHARIKTLAGANGIFASLFFGPALKNELEDDVKSARRSRVIQINGLGFAAPIMAEACLTAGNGGMRNPYAIIYRDLGAISRREVVEISSKFKMDQARALGAPSDAAIVIRQEGSEVTATVSIFGSPPFVLTAPACKELSPDFCPTVRTHEIPAADLLVFQPVAWQIVPFQDGVIFPRYVGSLRFERELALTLAVCENMEGSPIVQGFRSDPSNPLDTELVGYQYGDSDEAVTAMEGKLHKLHADLPGSVIVFEKQWGLETDLPDVIADITVRPDTMWEQASKERGGVFFD